MECRPGLFTGERVAAVAGSGSNNVLSGGIDAGRVDGLFAGMSIPGVGQSVGGDPGGE